MKRWLMATSALTFALAAALAIGVAVGSPFGGDGDLPPGGGPIVDTSDPVTSIDDVPDDECNLVHNIDACERMAVEAAVTDLAARLGADPRDIAFERAELVEWPDGCLGIEAPDTACIEVITPGFRVTLSAFGEAYEYHTDATGRAVLAE